MTAEFFLTKEQQAYIDERVASEWKRHLDYVESEKKRLEEKPQKMATAIALVEKLKAAGFPDARTSWGDNVSVHVDKKQLPALHKVVGRMKLDCKDLADARKRTIRVSLVCPAIPILSVSYDTKLPKDAPKCKIVRRKSTNVSLVCEI